jgi:putative addiction module component (TIGR02574 family)
MIAIKPLSEAAERVIPLLEQLPLADRLGLTHYLLETLDDAESELEHDIRTAWKAEILRRLEDIKSGNVKPVPIEEMFRKSREKYP